MIFDHDNDPLAAAKGILLGVAVGAIMWFGIWIVMRYLG